MKVLSNNIENSEVNNPLTAALEEIERLNKLIDEAKEILEAEFTSMQVEGASAYKPTFDEVNDTKINMLITLLF